jgi:hypothetical protein
MKPIFIAFAGDEAARMVFLRPVASVTLPPVTLQFHRLRVGTQHQQTRCSSNRLLTGDRISMDFDMTQTHN